jgi:neutral ceramidase
MKRFLIAAVLILGILFSLIGPINRTPLHERDFYQKMRTSFDTLNPLPSPKGRLKIGWSSFGIIPNYPMPMAGYAPRDHFDSVHDSLYTKLLCISNGFTTSYLISVDLLIFPPRLKELLQTKVKSPTDFIFLSASHTHSGLGGWDESLLGSVVAGHYDEEWLTAIADSILLNMSKAKQSALHARLSYWETDASEYVSNRLVENGKTDGKLRGLKVTRGDSTKAILFTYSAHPTNINHKAKVLSGDYPNATNKMLQKNGYKFSMFMAGMVGSHRLSNVEGADYELVGNTAKKLSEKIEKSLVTSRQDSATITALSIDLPLGSSQLRILKEFKIRDWLFTAVFGRLKADITYLKIGNTLFLGTSCDFSGELAVAQQFERIASSKGLNLIVTSFNGNYTGYITDDSHYDEVDREEVRIMNWVGPYYGEYYSEIVNLLIQK